MIANFSGAEAVHAVIFSTIPIIRGNQKEDATVQKFIREMAAAYRGFEKSTGYIWVQYVYGDFDALKSHRPSWSMFRFSDD